MGTGIRPARGTATATSPSRDRSTRSGTGLSDTSFSLEFDGAPEYTDGTIRARVRVENIGALDGETVVQLYARVEHATVVRPVRRLVQFARVDLDAGERRAVVLEAPVERLFHTLLDGRRGVEAGEVVLLAGLGSDDIRGTATIAIPAHRAQEPR